MHSIIDHFPTTGHIASLLVFSPLFLAGAALVTLTLFGVRGGIFLIGLTMVLAAIAKALI